MKKIKTNSKICTGCSLCTMACSITKLGVANPHKGAIAISRDPWKRKEKITVCEQCKKAKCIEACSEGALYYDEDAVVRVKQEACTKCGACVDACPFEAIRLIDDRLIKCDLCENGTPKCLRVCSTGAIQLLETQVTTASPAQRGPVNVV